MGLFKNQTHILIYVFILLESILCCYPFIRFFHKPVKNKWWLPLPPVLLLIYNLNGGFSMSEAIQLLVNTVFILLTAILIVSYNIILLPKRRTAQQSPIKTGALSGELASPFAANCLLYLLSKREIEVAALLCRGLTNPAIALRLHISLATVKSHVENILQKTHASSRLEAVHKLLYQENP